MTDDGKIHWQEVAAPRIVRPGRRWIGWIIVLAVVGGLVGFALVETDKIARDVAGGVVNNAVRSALALPDSQAVDADFGGGLFLFQALAGRVDELTVRIPGVAFGEVTADLVLNGTGVPLAPAKPVSRLTARVEVSEANMLAFSAYLSGAPLASITLADALVAANADVDIAGVVTPVSVALTPSTADGKVAFTPTTLTSAGATTTVEEALAGPLAPFIGPLLAPQVMCAAQYLPKALAVTAAEVVDKTFVITATGNDVALAGGGLSEKGACAA